MPRSTEPNVPPALDGPYPSSRRPAWGWFAAGVLAGVVVSFFIR